ncbi:MAG: hypothetical protein COB73_03335 [Flavobacteriaceae bacterium]|nr:MAG: hypothetical protein COB73_03335 [Flavobacteriaceae bacterium]
MKKLLLLLLFFPLISFAQYQVSGILTDTKTKEPLPFATVLINEYNGTVTNIDGEFILKSNKKIDEIFISYIGYDSKTIAVSKNNSFLKIELKQNVESLNEVVITSKENPALQIIRNAIKNKKKNNIELALNSFKFNAYNKLVITANPDSISGELDSIFKLKKDGSKHFITVDSTNYEFKKQLDRTHVYLTEKISNYTFESGKKKKETILASRMAGLQQPLYEFLAITIQDFDFYDNTYTVIGTKYANPIADNALKQYEYQILDTVKNTQGNSFMIYYKPKKKEDTVGLQGVLYIDDQSYAITSAIAELRGVIDVKATQSYKYIDEHNIWFPIETHITIKKGENGEDISLLGGTIEFGRRETKRDSTITRPKGKGPEDLMYFSSKSTNFDIEINQPVTVKRSANTLEIVDDAYKQDEEFWNKYRTDSITKRGEETYVFLDSVVEEEGIEKKLNIARKVLNGYFPTKYVDLDLSKIISYNNYEGFRLGVGGITNTNFSQKYRIESYVAFGTKDTDIKFKIGGSARLNRETNTWIGVNYTDDLKESASMDFISERDGFFALNTRNLNLSDFYNYKTTNVLLAHDFLPNLESKLQLSAGKYKPTFKYTYISPDKLLQDYNLTTATIGFQYNPNSEYMNSPLGKMRIKNGYPQYTLQITKSFENLFESDFDFTRVNLKVRYDFKQLRGSSTKFLFQGGIVFGQTPVSHLFNHSPNSNFQNPWARRVTFAGTNSFETMGYNEFLSDKFVSLQVKHAFKKFEISDRINPRLSLVTRAGVGFLENRIYHNGITIKTMEKGYFESGIELNSILFGLGFNAFYRYGAYQNPVWSDNLSVKLSYTLSLGF